MDMSNMSTSMSMSMAPSSTMSMAAASSSSAAAGMGGMDMGMGMGGGSACKISMTWNWYTVGACFISKTWQITSGGMFAGSCIGVIFLVVSLEFLRRVQREYESFIRRQDLTGRPAPVTEAAREHHASSDSSVDNKKGSSVVTNRLLSLSTQTNRHPASMATLLQRQTIRALLHMLQFSVAYFIMLLAMYYNGYIIICIIIGAFLGAFIFSWDQLLNTKESKSEAADVTGCCG